MTQPEHLSNHLDGLTSEEALARLRRFGPNEVAEEKPRLWSALLTRFSAPVPWMLEATVAIEAALGKWLEAGIVGVVLVFNALLGYFQESGAQAAIALLRTRLAVQARVLRDGAWQVVAAAQLVPGDAVHVRMGDLVPADLRLAEGQLLVDQSVLTGESVAVDLDSGSTAYAGSTVTRGEATAEVIDTGARTYFGRTAELVSTAQAKVHLEAVVFRMVRGFIALDLVLATLGTAYLAAVHAPTQDVLSFAVVLLLASVPVALPAAFTLAGALGSRHLADNGILTSRLSAIQEAAAMDILCVDKTGTITQNRLEVASLAPVATMDAGGLLRLAAEASEEATQDPIDLAILRAVAARGDVPFLRQKEIFVPFDPATKRSEALVSAGETRIHVTKGAPQVIAQLVAESAAAASDPAVADVEQMAARGERVLAVASADDGGRWLQAGLIGLADPARLDAGELISALHGLGVHVIMVTGDTLATARSVAEAVGIPGEALRAAAIRDQGAKELAEVGVFAEVLPEDKLWLVRALQQAGHVVGMTGDGVNDAPALRQAEVGIAVAAATDVAKSAAGAVLTREGLVGIVGLIEESRRIYQRSFTYALNVSVKKIEVPVLLSLGVLVWREFLFTPLLMALMLLANDVVAMSITTDRVSISRRPDRWKVEALLAGALAVAVPMLAISAGVLWFARDVWPVLGLDQLRSLVFLTLVLSAQASIYIVRERGHFWQSAPGRWLAVATAADIAAAGILVLTGTFMSRLAPDVVAAVLGVVLAASVAIDLGKVQAFRTAGLQRS